MDGQNDFSSQSAVIMQEIIKGLSCMLILLYTESTVSSAWNSPSEALKTVCLPFPKPVSPSIRCDHSRTQTCARTHTHTQAIPAMLYLVQNNFQYYAAGILDVVTYSVSAQTKIIWTGLFTVVCLSSLSLSLSLSSLPPHAAQLILRRELACNKWTALFMLATGVSLVNLGATSKEAQAKQVTHAERLLGLFFILTAAGCSSLAGVYFEKILKGCKVSLWTRNLQLAFYSVFTGLFMLYCTEKDRKIVTQHGFFYGYTPLTWVCVFMNAYGGLLVGCVIKYADAVLKDVSIGASICLSTLGSVWKGEHVHCHTPTILYTPHRLCSSRTLCSP